jgi:hypothetical protein
MYRFIDVYNGGVRIFGSNCTIAIDFEKKNGTVEVSIYSLNGLACSPANLGIHSVVRPSRFVSAKARHLINRLAAEFGEGRRGISGTRSVVRPASAGPKSNGPICRLFTTEVEIVKRGRIRKDGCLGSNYDAVARSRKS